MLYVCGISGIAVRNGRTPDAAILDRLEGALVHRGPDGRGRHCAPGIGLVSTRLAIIDLETGDQPFQNADGAVLVANGEIYNDLEIRKTLTDARYQSKSDCESALHLYQAKGLDFVDDLRGMYAIAIYDKSKSRLVLARDPFGIKQLYYVSSPDFFAFASEPQALIRAGLASASIDLRKSAELLQLKFTTGRETIFRGIYRVLPGEILVVSDAQIVERRRQSVLRKTAAGIGADMDPLRGLDAILKESVSAHLRSDVPCGLFLSGGIDSSVLLAAMSFVDSSPTLALTAKFPNSGAQDESETAARVAKATGARHDVVELGKADFWELSPRVAAALDDPTTDAAALPTYKLALRAQQDHLKVVLSGEGADEVFGGYGRYRRAAWSHGIFGRKTRTHGVFDGIINGHGRSSFDGWRTGLENTEQEVKNKDWTLLQNLQAIDCAEWLPNDLLVKFDRCLMANSIEGRTPFLDPLVGPFAFNLPDRLKVKGKLGKWLLRQWLSAHVPGADAFGRKTGFNPPIGEWMESYKDVLGELVLAQPGIAELSIADGARAALSTPSTNPQGAWSLVFYALWHSHHILGVRPDGSVGDVLAEAAHRA